MLLWWYYFADEDFEHYNTCIQAQWRVHASSWFDGYISTLFLLLLLFYYHIIIFDYRFMPTSSLPSGAAGVDYNILKTAGLYYI